MAFHDDALEAEEHGTVGFVRVHLFAQRLEGIPRKQVADPGAPGAAHRRAQIFGDLPRGALGRLQRDIAAEAFGDNDVGSALADAVAFDKADEVELRQVGGAQQFGRLADFLAALHFLDADIEQADGRALQVEQRAGHRRAHHGQRLQMVRVAADRGAEIEHHRVAACGRPDRRQRRAVDALQHAQAESRHRHQRAGIAGGDRDIGLALFDGVDRLPHRRHLAAAAQRLARLVVHADGDGGVKHLRHLFQRRMLR